MRYSTCVLLACMVMMTSAVWADEGAAKPQVKDPELLARSLPIDLLTHILRTPDRFSEDVATVILTYGATDGLTPGGIEEMILQDRAKARVAAFTRLLRADLDNDGDVSRSEIDALIAVSSQSTRGRLELGWRKADANENGAVDASELKDFAQRAAIAALTEEDAHDWRMVMKFDLNGNGGLTLDELIAAITALRSIDLALVRKEI